MPTFDKPNIVVVWGDGVGVHDLSSYTAGVAGYRTPNIDQLAEEGAIFTDAYGEQSSTAGRAAFVLGQHPVRTGLLTAGRPRSKHGIASWMPTIADLLHPHGYTSGHFGKSCLGDGDEHLPTAHGFDEFFGNLYDLETETEPESYYYPSDVVFRRKFSPRGVLHSWHDLDSTQTEDTGPLTRQRMATIDEEILIHARRFIERAVSQSRPFFVWVNSVNARSWAKGEDAPHSRETGVSPYADAMVRHDRVVGALLEQLADLKIDDRTIVLYSTDQGAGAQAHNGGLTPFRRGGTTSSEGKRRVPMLMRWPGVIKPRTQINEITAHMDWLPTLLTAAGAGDIKDSLRLGCRANGHDFKALLDGHDFVPFLTGRTAKGPRSDYFYFNDGGELEAVRVQDWKVYLKGHGDLVEDRIVNLRTDPYENAAAWDEPQPGRRWMVPLARERIAAFYKTFDKFPRHEVTKTLAAVSVRV